jgi:hypothetical protein
MQASAGGSTPTSPSTTASGSFSSRRPARARQSSSAPDHHGRAGLGAGHVSHRVRFRGGAGRARRPRRRREQGAPPWGTRRPVSTRRHQRSGERTGPDNSSYFSFATFSDPGGNTWLLQEVTTRLAGRIDATETTFASNPDLANSMRRVEAAHGEHEQRTGERDTNWPDWYAALHGGGAGGTKLPTRQRTATKQGWS